MNLLELTKRWLPRQKARPGERAVSTPGVAVHLEGGTRITYTKTRTMIPGRSTLAAHRVLLGGEQDPTSAHYKILRTQVIRKMSEAGLTTLGITSPSPKEGKTLTAINLAVSLAQKSNQTTLLADFDLRSPSIHTRLGCEPEYGLSDYLLGKVSLDKVLFNPGIEGLVVLPNLHVIANSAEVLSSMRVHELVEDLRTRYSSRFIVFDLPPVLGTDDTIAFLPCIEAILLVIQAGRTREDKVLRAMDMLESTRVIGTVLNRLTDEEVDVYY